MNKEIKEEVQAFKETMEKYGLSWSPDDIAASADYEQQPQDQKEFLMLRAAERWNAYHETLCEKGEKSRFFLLHNIALQHFMKIRRYGRMPLFPRFLLLQKLLLK